jgi:hypothetical protein
MEPGTGMSEEVAMSRFLAIVIVAFSFATLARPTTSAAQEQPKWFVLRDHQTGACWLALLIKIDGVFRHGFAQTAGGPYDTEELATERRKALQETGTCQQ